MTTLTAYLARRAQRRRDRRALLVLWAIDGVGLTTALDIINITDLGSGSIYPVLVRLEAGGLVTSEWSHPQPLPDGKPRRRYYQVTEAGRAHIHKLVAQLKEGR